MCGRVPRVGIGVLIFRDRCVLVGRRRGKGKLGAGEWALPGGHLEFAESLEDGAAREVLEETGLTLHNTRFEYVANCVHHDASGRPASHYVTLLMRGDVDQDSAPQNLEPEKCEGWVWVPWPHVPQPAFMGLQKLLDSGYDPFPADVQ